MGGHICPKCGEADNLTVPIKCGRVGCPGRETFKPFVHVMPDVRKCDDGADHNFTGWRPFADGNGGEQVCSKCGLGAQAWTLMVSS